MFSTNNLSSVNEKAAMAPGERVKAQLVEVKVDDQGHFKTVFQNNSGKLTKTEFMIDPSNPSHNIDAAKASQERIIHILTAFVPESTFAGVEAPDFKSWCGMLIAKLGTAYVGKECELKAVVNKKGYVDFPYFPNFISTEFRPLSWTSNPKYDKYVFPTDTPDVEVDTANAAFDTSNNDVLGF